MRSPDILSPFTTALFSLVAVVIRSYNDVFMVMENIHIRSDKYIGILSITIF